MATQKSAQETDIRALVAACLRCEGLTQEKIVGRMTKLFPEGKQSQTTVSRLLAECREKQWLVERIDWDAVARTNSGYKEIVEDCFFRFDFLKEWAAETSEYGEHCRIHVVRETTFDSEGADVVRQLLNSTKVCGITWGRSPRLIVDQLKKNPPNARVEHVVPLSGEPCHLRNLAPSVLDFGSPQLAKDLQELLLERHSTAAVSRPDLRGVIAYVSAAAFTDEDETAREAKVSAVMEYVKTIKGYIDIFGDGHHQGWIDKTDTILTGLGVIARDEYGKVDEKKSGTFIRERIAQNDRLSFSRLSKIICGDCAGLLIAKTADPAVEREVKALNDGWIGLKLEHLMECNQRAVKSGRPGTVVLAPTPNRVEIVRAVIERGIALQCIISASVAAQLEKQLHEDAERQRK